MTDHLTSSSRPLAASIVAALVTGGSLLGAPANAATFDFVENFQQLQDRLTTANALPGRDTIELFPNAELQGDGAFLVVTDSLTLDLNGGELQASSIIVIGGDLTIKNGALFVGSPDESGGNPGIGVHPTASLVIDSAFVTATGAACDAGIGGYTSTGDGCGVDSSTTPGPITIQNSVVTATGGMGAAGIGGGFRGTLSTLTIVDSRVDAQGRSSSLAPDGGAGLGGGAGGDGGTITITDSTVNATGADGAAGIGGGGQYDTGGGLDLGNGATVTILGGTVTASAGAGAAGIGGGFGGHGGSTAIGDDAVVTALGNTLGASIGGGTGGDAGTTFIGGTSTVNALYDNGGTSDVRGIGPGLGGSPIGIVEIGGTPTVTTSLIEGLFTVGSGAVLSVGSSLDLSLRGVGFVFGSLEGTFPGTIEILGGTTLNNLGRIDGSARLIGEGRLINDGSICAPVDDEATNPEVGDLSGLTVTGNAFSLPYRYPAGFGVGNTVYAPTMQDGCRSFPDVSYLPDGETTPLVNVGWTLTEDGTGPFVTETTDLRTVAPSSSGTFWPTMAPAEIIASATPSTVAAGATSQLSVSGPWPLSNAESIDLTDRAEFSDAGQTAGTAPGEVVFTEAGEKSVTASVEYLVAGDPFIAEDTTSILVAAAELEALEVSASATTVPQGGSILLSVEGRDEFGNPIVVLPEDVTVTSSVPTDVIDGLTVTFPTASPHVLTVTVGDVSAQVTIEVQPAAVVPPAPPGPDLAATGSGGLAPWAAIALLMLALGAIATGAHRLRRRVEG